MMYLLTISLAPVVAIILYVYFKDKYDREPISTLIISFFLGVLSTVPTLIVGSLFRSSGGLDVYHYIRVAFLEVAGVEEGFKFLFFFIYCYRHKDFNEPFDGIVYALMVSMGFAGLENILYVYDGGLHVALMRALTAVPAHATFAVAMGYFAGKAKFSKFPAFWLLIGLAAAIIMHGFYDFCLFTNDFLYIGIGAFISLGISVYLSSKAINSYHHLSELKFKNKIEEDNSTVQ